MKHKKLVLHSTLFLTAGTIYTLCEKAYRGFSHWTMFVLSGLVFIPIGQLNKRFSWDMPLVLQMLIGSSIITLGEFITGCIVNLRLGWNVWDYSDMPGNILGQICPQSSALWCIAALAIILLDDFIRYKFFGEEKPRYTFVRWGNG